MYSIENLKTVLKKPNRVFGIAHHFGTIANQHYYERFSNHTGTPVIDEDWDNLFILDGCRYDLFEDTNTIDGTLESRTSVGSSSSEFLQRNFGGETFHDTVYITANPHTFELEDRTFHATINLLDDGWDADLYTVRPETVADAVRKATDEYPQKRLIAHFMQPHYPFIGEVGQQINQGGIGRRDETGEVVERANEGDIWRKLQFRLGDISQSSVWDAYRENLELVLNEVEALLDDIDGKTVVSSDHGNLVGEWIGPIPSRGYGHPPKIYVDELVTVPWLIIPGNRRTISSDPPVERERLEDNVVADRLTALGYN